jgi:Predicted outer membrane protein
LNNRLSKFIFICLLSFGCLAFTEKFLADDMATSVTSNVGITFIEDTGEHPDQTKPTDDGQTTSDTKDSNARERLPQTGEKQTNTLIFLGTFILAVLLFFTLKKQHSSKK